MPLLWLLNTADLLESLQHAGGGRGGGGSGGHFGPGGCMSESAQHGTMPGGGSGGNGHFGPGSDFNFGSGQ